jgi:hypothetical protein
LRVKTIFLFVLTVSLSGFLKAQEKDPRSQNQPVAPAEAVPAISQSNQSGFKPASVSSVPLAQKCWPSLAERKERVKPSLIVKNLRIKSDQEKIDLPSGESYVQLVELPAFKSYYDIEIRLSFTFKGMMVPSAAVLDENFCLIKDYPVLDFELESTFGGTYEKAFIPIDSLKKKYVLAYVNKESLKYPVNVSFGGFKAKPMQRFDSGYSMIRINK